LSSVFGTVPNLCVLAEAVHEIARGNPRESMDVAQHLVDRGVVRYAAGSWTLPERIDRKVLAFNAEDTMRERIAALEPLARFLAEAQALASFDSCSRDDYVALRPDVEHQAIDRALVELIAAQILLSDGTHYVLARHWAVLLSAGLDAEQGRDRHRALARAYEHSRPFAAARHLLAAGERERGVACAYAYVQETSQSPTVLWERSGGMRPKDLLETLESAHQAAIDLGRPRRERIVTAGWLVGISINYDESYFVRVVAEWRSQLEHDSGYLIDRQLEDISDPGERLMRALTLLSERYAATPEAERA